MPLPPSVQKPSILCNTGDTTKDFAYHLLQQNNMSQQKIMDGSIQLFLDTDKKSSEKIQIDEKLKTDLCLILCEPSDRINRILGYFSQNKHRLHIPQGQPKIQLTHFLLSLFEQCLLEIGQLEKQYQLSPDLFDAIGQFLSEAYKDALQREKDPYLCLWLVRTSHALQGFCRKLTLKLLHTFPTYSNMRIN